MIEKYSELAVEVQTELETRVAALRSPVPFEMFRPVIENILRHKVKDKKARVRVCVMPSDLDGRLDIMPRNMESFVILNKWSGRPANTRWMFSIPAELRGEEP